MTVILQISPNEHKTNSFCFIHTNGKLYEENTSSKVFSNLLLFHHAVENPIQPLQLAIIIRLIVK